MKVLRIQIKAYIEKTNIINRIYKLVIIDEESLIKKCLSHNTPKVEL